MSRSGFFLRFLFAMLLLVFVKTERVKAGHIIGGDVYWECLTSGPDAGKIVFYLKLYRDCSINSVVTPNQEVWLRNHPTLTGEIQVNLISQEDISLTECGFDCASGVSGTVEKFVFASNPIALTGVPPPDGYRIEYFKCCRSISDNLQDASTQEIFYSATMYPYNGQDAFPCFDSSPRFAEEPTSAICSGYQIRYNSNALDPDLDSLSYEFVDPLGTNGIPVPHTSGFSATEPLPGPTTNASFDLITINPTTGQINYDSPSSVQGDYSMAIAVYGWRCGQRISRTIREMRVSIVACSEPNNVPTVGNPVWSSPGTGSGYEVTVLAGDLVNFTISGTDNDLTGGNPQTLEFTATGGQFDQSITGQSGCVAPCATLSNVSPPATGTGTISTTFNWQTTCDHVSLFDECANYSSTYNFIFKFRDDFCPVRGTNMVNVAVTVVGDPVVDSPDPHCVSTAANGDITLTWDPVTDNAVPPSFVEYVILHSTSPNGPFQEIATEVNINVGTYAHTAGNPVAPPTTSGANYYLIRTRSGCNDAVLDAPVDTVSSIFLTLTNTGTTADLNWTAVATPPLPSSNGNGQGLYQIYREYPVGTWTLIGSTFNLYYSDPIIWCNEQVNYRIELTDNLPCVSVSNVVGDVLNNPAQPEPQQVDSVTVDPVTGFVTICWSPNPSLNVVEYNIYWNPEQFNWELLETVQGYNTTCWTDSFADPQSGPVYYQVTATNNCGQEGLAAGSGANGTNRHLTIWLQDAVDGCAREANLEWTRYWYWPAGVKEYEVYSSKDGQPYELIGTVDDTIREFTHTGLDEEAVYCHYVRAVQEGPTRITATSNAPCSYVYVPKRPEYGYSYTTTVQPGNTGVEEYFFIDSTAGYIGFEIQRGKEPDALNYLYFLPFDPNTRYYDFVDAGARPAFNSYYYSVIGIDSCDAKADTMNMTRTILLEAEANANRTNSLQWNPYEGFRGNVSAYNIYRSVDGVFSYLTTVPPNQLTYTDSIQEIIIGDGNFCYYIEAVEGIGPPVGPMMAPPEPVQFQELSRSNEDCARQHPNVFMPNAFMPEGVNNTFKPVSVYVNADSYLFQIYNRWGGRVFETTDPNQAWDGTNGGKKEPQGAYVYFVSFVSSKGKTYTKSGSVTLIR